MPSTSSNGRGENVELRLSLGPVERAGVLAWLDDKEAEPQVIAGTASARLVNLLPYLGATGEVRGSVSPVASYGSLAGLAGDVSGATSSSGEGCTSEVGDC
jgi:hypothetical protein